MNDDRHDMGPCIVIVAFPRRAHFNSHYTVSGQTRHVLHFCLVPFLTNFDSDMYLTDMTTSGLPLRPRLLTS